MSTIYRNGFDAFRALNDCGLDLHERDKELTDLLRIALDPRAISLQQALANSTPEQFVKAFLTVSAPYVLMLTDILKMFRAADANIGEKDWKIQFDDFLEEVEHFKEWERITRSIGTSVVCPNPSFLQFWNCMRILRESVLGPDFFTSGKLLQPQFALAAPTREHPGWMHDLWAIAVCAQNVLAEAGHDLLTARARDVFRKTEEDFFSVANLCQQQHDFGITQLAVAYEALHGSASSRDAVGNDVTQVLSPARRQLVWLDATVEELRSFLNLPIWQRRHDFYAAWVAAIMLDVFRDDGIVIHHEDGVISFPFRETMVGQMIDGTANLISERRISLKNPVGAGRHKAVQPDYGWWKPPQDGEAPRAEECLLVVEVKHYKKAARSSWHDVLFDYASAHPRAKVLVVNYGPGSDSAQDLPADLATRCAVIGNLRPNAILGMEPVADHFRKLVKSYVATKRNVLALDISASMAVRDQLLAELIHDFAREFDCDTLLALDTEIAHVIPVSDLNDAVVHGLPRNRGEDFERTLREALESFDQVSLITDSAGVKFADTSKRFRVQVRHLRDDLHLLIVGRSDATEGN